jgi:hypothetical protein
MTYVEHTKECSAQGMRDTLRAHGMSDDELAELGLLIP